MKHIIYLQFFIYSLLCMPVVVSAQSTVLFEHKTDSVPDKWGPNRKYYSALAMSIGMSLANNNDNTLRTKFSFPQLNIGYKFKHKFTKVFSMCYQAGLRDRNYLLADNNAFPDTFLYGSQKKHLKQHMNFFDVNGEINLRINFDPDRGDITGNFLEFGAYASYMIYNETVIKDDGPGRMIIKTHYIYAPFLNPAEYGFQARLGHNLLALEFSYRLSDIFYHTYQAPELSRYIIGLHFGL